MPVIRAVGAILALLLTLAALVEFLERDLPEWALVAVFLVCFSVYAYFDIYKGEYKKYRKNRDERESKVTDFFDNKTKDYKIKSSDPKSALKLVQEKYQIVDFKEGMQKEFCQLIKWMKEDEGEKSASVFLIHGGPGRGKSRLARELCKNAKNAWREVIDPDIQATIKEVGFIKKSWTAGFLSEGKKNFADLFKNCQKPLLIVIDAAARRLDEAEELVKAVCEYEPGSSFFAGFLDSPPKVRPVRIILIARSEDLLSNEQEDDSELGESFLSKDKLSPSPIKEGKDSRERRKEFEIEFDRALECFKHKLKELGVTVNKDKKSEQDYLEGLLDAVEAEEMRMLDVHIAALLAAHGDKTDIGDDGAKWRRKPKLFEGKLLEELIRREEKHWAEGINSIQETLEKKKKARYAVAWLGATNPGKEVTNLNGVLADRLSLADRLNCLQDFKGEAKKGDREGIEKVLQELYPDEQKDWGGILPERIATWLAGDPDLTGKIKESVADLLKLEVDRPEGEGALGSLLRRFVYFMERYKGEEKEKDDAERVEDAFEHTLRAGGMNAFVAITELAYDLMPETRSTIDGIAAEVLKETKDRTISGGLSSFYLFGMPELQDTAAQIELDAISSDKFPSAELPELKSAVLTNRKFNSTIMRLLRDMNESDYSHERADRKIVEYLPDFENIIALCDKYFGIPHADKSISNLLRMTLSNLDVALTIRGQADKLRPIIERGVDMLEKISKDDDEWTREEEKINWATGLGVLSNCLLRLEEPENDKAYEKVKKAVDTFEDLLEIVGRDPYLPEFAPLRKLLCICMFHLEKFSEEEERDEIQKTIKVYTELEEKMGKAAFNELYRPSLEELEGRLRVLSTR